MAPLLGAEQGLGASYSSLLGSLKGLGASADPVEVSPEQEASLLETLRRLVFIRETLTFSSEHEALGAICLGWLLALLCAGPRQDFEALQVTWMRAITTDDLHDKLFDTRREARSWLRALSSS